MLLLTSQSVSHLLYSLTHSDCYSTIKEEKKKKKKRKRTIQSVRWIAQDETNSLV